MSRLKLLTIALIAALILAVAVNVYQYTLNLEVSKQKNEASAQLEMKTRLSQVQSEVNGELQSLDEALIIACGQLSVTGLTGAQANAVLSGLVANNSLIVNAATADAKDVLLAVEPKNYSGIIGEDISGQEQNIHMHQIMRPVMSNLIPLVEGFPGVVMVAPVFNTDNRFIGSLSIVIQPRALIEKYVTPTIADGQFSMWSMQLNGTLIFDPDPAQQGKNLLTDPIYTDYPEVQAFTHQVAVEKSGYGTYNFFDKNLNDSSGRVISKEAYWTTIGVYNAQWRLVIVHFLT
jgi:branched-chain amino acid transport system substrate-binding protein